MTEELKTLVLFFEFGKDVYHIRGRKVNKGNDDGSRRFKNEAQLLEEAKKIKSILAVARSTDHYFGKEK